MTLLLDAPPGLRGAQRPSHSLVPRWSSSTGTEAIELCDLAGLTLDTWQQWCLRNALGEQDDGQWAAFGVGVVVPRQNGKTGLAEARILTGLFLLGEPLIIYSAHQFDTSQETFERVVSLVENSSSLSKRLARNGISRSHGSEGIKLKNGQRCRFRTRTKGGGRGFTADCLILDEAMILPDAFMSAVLPVLSSRPNPQVWYLGSSVDQTIHEHCVVIARVRKRALDGSDPRLFYAEWCGAESVTEVLANPSLADDPAAWTRANPALGIRISPEYIAAERQQFAGNVRGFAVERLGAGDWPSTNEADKRVISPADWSGCHDPDSEIAGPLVIAVDVSPTRSACIAAAGERGDHLVAVEIIDHRSGTNWVVDRLIELVHTRHPVTVCLDAGGPAGSLMPALESRYRDLTITPLGAKDLVHACGLLYDAVAAHELRHRGDAPLDLAVEGAARRTVGESWAWSRKNALIDISPLVAVTLAYAQVKGLEPGVGVASFSDFERSMTPESIEDLKRSQQQRIEEVLAKARGGRR